MQVLSSWLFMVVLDTRSLNNEVRIFFFSRKNKTIWVVFKTKIDWELHLLQNLKCVSLILNIFRYAGFNYSRKYEPDVPIAILFTYFSLQHFTEGSSKRIGRNISYSQPYSKWHRLSFEGGFHEVLLSETLIVPSVYPIRSNYYLKNFRI